MEENIQSIKTEEEKLMMTSSLTTNSWTIITADEDNVMENDSQFEQEKLLVNDKDYSSIIGKALGSGASNNDANCNNDAEDDDDNISDGISVISESDIDCSNTLHHQDDMLDTYFDSITNNNNLIQQITSSSIKYNNKNIEKDNQSNDNVIADKENIIISATKETTTPAETRTNDSILKKFDLRLIETKYLREARCKFLQKYHADNIHYLTLAIIICIIGFIFVHSINYINSIGGTITATTTTATSGSLSPSTASSDPYTSELILKQQKRIFKLQLQNRMLKLELTKLIRNKNYKSRYVFSNDVDDDDDMDDIDDYVDYDNNDADMFLDENTIIDVLEGGGDGGSGGININNENDIMDFCKTKDKTDGKSKVAYTTDVQQKVDDLNSQTNQFKDVSQKPSKVNLENERRSKSKKKKQQPTLQRQKLVDEDINQVDQSQSNAKLKINNDDNVYNKNINRNNNKNKKNHNKNNYNNDYNYNYDYNYNTDYKYNSNNNNNNNVFSGPVVPDNDILKTKDCALDLNDMNGKDSNLRMIDNASKEFEKHLKTEKSKKKRNHDDGKHKRKYKKSIEETPPQKQQKNKKQLKRKEKFRSTPPPPLQQQNNITKKIEATINVQQLNDAADEKYERKKVYDYTNSNWYENMMKNREEFRDKHNQFIKNWYFERGEEREINRIKTPPLTSKKYRT